MAYKEPRDIWVLHRMIALRNTGRSYQKIADSLTKEGIPTFLGRSKWSKTTVYNLLKTKEPHLTIRLRLANLPKYKQDRLYNDFLRIILADTRQVSRMPDEAFENTAFIDYLSKVFR